MTKLNKISTESQYQSVMQQIEQFMQKGSGNLTEGELLAIRVLSEAAQEYEQSVLNIELPSNLSDLLLVCMDELEMNTQEFANYLSISESTLQALLKDEAKADITILKTLHEKLKIEADFLLEAA